MKAQYSIPSLLILSTTTTACGDPLIGLWSANTLTIENNDIPIPYTYNGEEVISSVEVNFEEDLSGFWEMKGTESYAMNVQATNNGGGKYSILSDNEDNEGLDCSLSASTLECSATSFTIVFSKGAKD